MYDICKRLDIRVNFESVREGDSVANIFDYLDWRGDLTVRQAPMNAIDCLILSTLAYVDFEMTGLDLSGNEGVTIKEAGFRFQQLNADKKINPGRIIPMAVIDMFDILSRCERFKNMKLSNYVNQIDEVDAKQFSAITIELDSHSFFLAFRGTDDTLVGWKESFSMSFRTPIPSQLQAVEYLNQVTASKEGSIWMGGHSKGGNLSVYAAAFTRPAIRRRIKEVYNFDGPGFTKEIMEQPGYRGVNRKVRTIVPQSSVIGMLLEHDEDYEVVVSDQIGIFQHDMFSWQLMGNDFIYVDDISASSYKIDHTLRNSILSMDTEEKEKFVEALFYVFQESGAKNLSDIRIKEVITILKQISKEEGENKKILKQAFRLLLKSLEEQTQPQLLKQAERQIEKMKIIPKKKQL